MRLLTNRDLACVLLLCASGWGSGCAAGSEDDVPAPPNDREAGAESAAAEVDPAPTLPDPDTGSTESAPDGCTTEGCACVLGSEQSCYGGPKGAEGIGLCKAGKRSCTRKGELAVWGPCEGEVTPEASEQCDGKDHNCDGRVDEGCCGPVEYALTTGFTGSGTSVCCKGSDKLVSTTDCGDGKNHWVTNSGTCGTAFEGKGNYGAPCVSIKCAGTLCK